MSALATTRLTASRRLVLSAAAAAGLAISALAPVQAQAHNGIEHTANGPVAGARTASMSALYAGMQTLWAQHME